MEDGVIPSPQDQILFLQNVQRLLTDGLFVASYKFALLRALADLAVTKGDDSGDGLTLDAAEIGVVFVELYWRQTRPLHLKPESDEQLLRQSTGRQAAIIRSIADAQSQSGGSLAKFRRDQMRWNQLVRDVSTVIATMPLWKLQRVGDEIVDFLYPNVGRGRTISLRPGVAYCLRRFYGLLRNLVEGAWLNYVRSLNYDLLGQTVDLGTFLFGSERTTLEVYRPVLREVQKDQCFYCGDRLGSTGEVDHFVPWSRYPLDLGHNFVLAHASCNRLKSDHLAAEEHLAAWVERHDRHKQTLIDVFSDLRVNHDFDQSVRICRWAYGQAATANGLVWVRANELRRLGPEWAALLRAG